MRILVTGGAGFIGSAFIRFGLKEIHFCEKIVNLDLLTYAANLEHLKSVEQDSRYFFIQGDICDEPLVERLCIDHKITHVVHFAAESHVDRSITGPKTFFSTNVGGTLALLEVIRRHPKIHFHHISTDEVYGSLGEQGFFCETSCYQPNSPYAASKAASDHFVRAYAHTYDLSTTLSHCTNNYGPYQHNEKLIPLMIFRCLNKEPLPVYGDGKNVRDWLYVDDHVEGVWKILEQGKKGEVYDMGGGCEKKNIDLIHELILCVSFFTKEDPAIYRNLISFISDRPGHDFRYAIDCSKIEHTLGWKPRHSFKEGLKKTVHSYLQKYQVKK